MALKLKLPTPDNKGIIILTHKELHLLPKFSSFRDRYLIGAHIGCYAVNRDIRGCDFYLSSLNQLNPRFPHKEKVIELNSRNFLPNEYAAPATKSLKLLLGSIEAMHKVSSTKMGSTLLAKIQEHNQDPIWDILWVNKPHQVKNMEIFLKQLKKLFNIHGPHHTLLICAEAPNERKHPAHHLNVEAYINQHFTPPEKTFITLFRPRTGGNEGLDNHFIPPFYHWSRNFVFYTKAEGESRVVHEALCAGCPIIYWKGFQGGAADYLDNSNSFAFSKFENSYLTLNDAISNPKTFDPISIQKKCLVRYSFQTLKDSLQNIYAQHNQVFNGDLLEVPNLHFELPAHNHKVPWKDPAQETGDLTGPYLHTFIQHADL